MTQEEYLDKIRQVRAVIQMGTKAQIEQAAAELDALKDMRPWHLEYICARVALMLAQQEDKNLCRAILSNIDQEFYPHPELVDIFALKQQTYEVGSIEAQQCGFSVQLYQNASEIERYFSILSAQRKKFLSGNCTIEILRQLAESYYIVRNYLMYAVLFRTWCQVSGQIDSYDDYLADDAGMNTMVSQINLRYLLRMFSDGEKHTFLLVDDLDKPMDDIYVLEKALQLLGYSVIILGQGSLQDTGDSSTVDVMVRDSVQQATAKGSSIYIHPAVYQTVSGEALDTRGALIQFLAESIEQEGPLLVFTSDCLMDGLEKEPSVAQEFQRLYACQPDMLGYTMSFAWAGDYLKYISYLYGFSVRERLERPAQCTFSIVLPVRNNVATLRYTLQTCLNQRYIGDYEIVISDNSDYDNKAVYELCQDLQDSHIYYYRTPHILDLAKSFEFAFLQARGEFIFSLGADDAIFPWTLEILSAILPQMDGYDILHWCRGFYAWPGFNDGQQNQLVMPLSSNAQDVQLKPYVGEKSLQEMLEHPMLYNMPLLYINSGFRRSYFDHLLQSTGRLWDGSSQDIYMGVVNLAIQDSILCTAYPLSMAGMSGNSIGAQSAAIEDDLISFGKKCFKVERDCKENASLSAYVFRRNEYKVPFCYELDTLMLYGAALRLADFGVVYAKEREPSQDLTIDFYVQVLSNLSIMNICFARGIGYIRYAISLQDEHILDLINEKIVDRCTPCVRELEAPLKVRSYTIGFDAQAQMLCVDGSEFGITNIKEAVDFYTKVSGY